MNLDRTLSTLKFALHDGDTGSAPAEIRQLAGTTVTIPSGKEISRPGNSFSGWTATNDQTQVTRYFGAGQFTTMPSGSWTLVPAWGHVKVELELGGVKKGDPPGNNMKKDIKAASGELLDFYNVSLADGNQFGVGNTLYGLYVLDRNLSYTKDGNNGGDPNKVKVHNDSSILYARHVGKTDNDNVIAYIVKSQKGGEGKYDLCIAGPGGVKASGALELTWSSLSSRNVVEADLSALDTSAVTDMSGLFNGCNALERITLGKKFDTSQVTSLARMFESCHKLKELDLSGFNTENVTEIHSMFSGCHGLQNIKFGDKFTTDEVTIMASMFRSCSSLTELDISMFDTSKVKDMSSMFSGCTSLETLKLGEKFTGNSVTNVSQMFFYSGKLKELDFSHFTAPELTSTSEMFSGLSGLQTLKLPASGFITEKTKDMSRMFFGCYALTNIEELVKTFDTSQVTDMGGMFQSCQQLTEIDMSMLDTSNVTSMGGMFSFCNNLKKVIFKNPSPDAVNKFTTEKVESLGSMFRYCKKLEQVDLTSFKTNNLQDISYMFSECESLPNADLSSFDTSKITDMSKTFESCGKLKELNLGDNFDVSQVTDFNNMFYYCTQLSDIKGKFRLGESNKATTFKRMFLSCYQLEEIPFALPQGGKAEFPSLNTVEEMFLSASKLTKVNLDGWVLDNLTNTSHMFADCGNLKDIRLNWDLSNTPEDSMNCDKMFHAVPKESTLYVGAKPLAPAMEKVVKAYSDAAGGSVVYAQANTLPSAAGSMEAAPESVAAPERTASPAPIVAPAHTAASEAADIPAPADTPEPEMSPAPETLEETGAGKTGGLGTAEGRSAASVRPASVMRAAPLGTDPADGGRQNGTIVVHDTATPANSRVEYRIRVKYEGDMGAQSGRIDVRFPIPENVHVMTKDELEKWKQEVQNGDVQPPEQLVSVSDVEYSDQGSYTGYLTGRVVEPPKVERGADGKEYLTASFERLYTGNEYKISVWCVLDNHDKGADNYLYWDGIAQAQDRSGSAVSNVYRLWYKDGEGTAPNPSGYQLSYAFAGELPPDAVVPAGGVYTDGTEVTAAQKPASQYGYYTFTGWVRSDTGKEVTPGDKFNMPGSNLTLTGTWTINREQAPTVTVQYQYDKEIPGAPELPGSVQVLVGENHSIMSIQNDEYYHSFAGWTPTLTIGGKPVNLTPGPNGYTGTHGKTTLVIPSTGVLTTEQFRDLVGADSAVEITYTGKWNPYSGTIHFDPNGASGQVASLRNVTWDTEEVLPEGKGALTHPSAAYQFVGWTSTVDGTDVKQPGASAKGIITQNNQEVKMFAKWSRSVFDVVYQLSQVTSTNTARQADLNSQYTTTLQTAPGWAIDTVQVTMNGMTLTGVYNQDTGEISIPAVTGDIIITATARQNGGGSGGGSGTRYTLRYQSNGGTAYPEERYAPGTVVRLTKAPTREGCTFTGWYEDPELTQKITQVTMNSSKTVYAGWKVVERHFLVTANITL